MKNDSNCVISIIYVRADFLNSKVNKLRRVKKLIADLKPANLPGKKGFWKYVGPGAILIGLSIGSGELIMWPNIVAQYGVTMVWAPLFGVFCQYWVNQELGRYTLATGESVYTGYARVSKFFVFFFIVMNVIAFLIPGWAVASGTALKALVVGSKGWGSHYFWTWMTFLLIVLVIYLPWVIEEFLVPLISNRKKFFSYTPTIHKRRLTATKLSYLVVEKLEIGLVLILIISLIAVVVILSKPHHWSDIGKGITNFGFIDPKVNKFVFFAGIVYAGCGGTANIFLNYYLINKGMGMGARMGYNLNPTTGESYIVPSTGFLPSNTRVNLFRWKRWFNHFRLEQIVTFWATNSFVIMLFIIASFATLYPATIPLSGFDVIEKESEILSAFMGMPGRILFLLVAFIALFTTQIGVVDGLARTLSDLVYVNFPRSRKYSLSFWYLVFIGMWVFVGGVLSVFSIPPLVMLITSACIGGIAMAVYCPLTLYINWKYLPKGFKPDIASSLFLGIASLLYIFFMFYSLVWIVLQLFRH